MVQSQDRSLAVVCSLAASLGLISACSLTGPLDGYSEGDPPEQPGADAGNDVTQDGPVDDTRPDQEAADCPAGFGDCDGDPNNGCEADLATSLDHCGGCDSPCAITNGTGICTGGSCLVESCFVGFGDCDDDPDTGCETDTTSSSAHCGSCQSPCEFTNAIGNCSQSECSMGACSNGYADCDDDESTGCEIHTDSSLFNCGTCGNACEARPNSTPLCSDGQCVLQCEATYDDCDGDYSNGCEADLQTDVEHCGACSVACSDVNATPACVAATCEITCDTDYANCDDDVTTGCEVDLANDPTNCGGCFQPCPVPDSATATCASLVCGFACLPGFGDCNADGVDGCETNTTADDANCAACGRSCLGGNCVGGKCSVEQLASGLNRPAGIVLNAAYVFWTDSYDNAVYRVSKSGGTVTTLTTGGAIGPITRAGSTLYFATGAALARMETNGSSKQNVAPGENYVADLVHDGTSLFWLRPGTWSGSTYNGDGSVATVSMGGGSVTTLATNQKRPRALVVDDNYVYWANEGTYTGMVYNNDGSVIRVSKAGGATTTIASAQSKPCGIAVDADAVYWMNCGNGVVMRDESGGTGPEALLSGQSASAGLTLEGGELFWPYAGSSLQQPTGDVRKLSLSPLSALVLADTQIQPYRLAVDATHVYWLNHGAEGSTPPGDGGVLRVPR